jgi:hypothetical protein
MKYILISNRTATTGDVVTVAMDPADPRPITFLDLVVEVTQPAMLTIEMGGAAPAGGSNQIFPTPLTVQGPSAMCDCFNQSTTSGGTPVSIAMSIPPGVPFPIELKHLWMGGAGPNRLMTFRLSHASGNSKMALYFDED